VQADILAALLRLEGEVGALRSDVKNLQAHDTRITKCETAISSVSKRQHFLAGIYAGGAAIIGYWMKA